MAINVAGALIIFTIGWLLYGWLGNLVQWTALGIGVYCSFTWVQSLSQQSPDVFDTIFHSPTILLCGTAFPLMSLVTYGTGFWVVPYILRAHDVSATEVGLIMGVSAAVAGLIGVAFGGWLADKLFKKYETGRLLVGIFSAVGAVPAGIAIMYADSLWGIYVLYFIFLFFKPIYLGPVNATLNDLVLPRMRGTVTALYLLNNTTIGLALGPYIMGVISTRLSQSGMDSVAALRTGVIWPFVCYGIACILVLIACKTIKKDHVRIKELTAKYSG